MYAYITIKLPLELISQSNTYVNFLFIHVRLHHNKINTLTYITVQYICKFRTSEHPKLENIQFNLQL